MVLCILGCDFSARSVGSTPPPTHSSTTIFPTLATILVSVYTHRRGRRRVEPASRLPPACRLRPHCPAVLALAYVDRLSACMVFGRWGSISPCKMDTPWGGVGFYCAVHSRIPWGPIAPCTMGPPPSPALVFLVFQYCIADAAASSPHPSMLQCALLKSYSALVQCFIS